jgi:hypothetical protein
MDSDICMDIHHILLDGSTNKEKLTGLNCILELKAVSKT